MARKNRLALYISICVAAALAVGLGLYFFFAEPARPQTPVPAGALTAVTLDTGDSDCHIVTSPDGKVMMIDTGLADSCGHIADYLRAQGVGAIDILVLTHPHKDHIGGAAALLGEFPVRAVYTVETSHTSGQLDELNRALAQNNLQPQMLHAGDSFSLGEIQISVLAPLPGIAYEEVNDYSAVLAFAHGRNRFLYMGDAEKTAEKDLLAAYPDEVLQADVLKVGHHGDDDASSKSFLQAVSPTYAIISADAAQDDDHAHPKTLEKLQNAGATILRTDERGDITIVSDGETLSVR